MTEGHGYVWEYIYVHENIIDIWWDYGLISRKLILFLEIGMDHVPICT